MFDNSFMISRNFKLKISKKNILLFLLGRKLLVGIKENNILNIHIHKLYIKISL